LEVFPTEKFDEMSNYPFWDHTLVPPALNNIFGFFIYHNLAHVTMTSNIFYQLCDEQDDTSNQVGPLCCLREDWRICQHFFWGEGIELLSLHEISYFITVYMDVAS
jgi:hypothetical protein